MKILGIILASLAFAGVIISPFFWLGFLRAKSVGRYLVVSSILTLLFFWFSLTWLYDFLLNPVNSYDVLDYFDNISLGYSFMVFFFIIISPLIFIKIVQQKFTLKSFAGGLLLSLVLFISIFLFWALVLLPQAFNQLHNYF
jgi:hypothetical protein